MPERAIALVVERYLAAHLPLLLKSPMQANSNGLQAKIV
jgi:hypothetical protein